MATSGITTALYPVTDLEAAQAVFTALLGTEPMVASDDYVGYQVGAQHVGLLPNGGPQGLPSPLTYWGVTDLDAAVQALTDAGATVTEAPRPVGGGRRVAAVTDADGNAIGLSQD